PDETTEVPKEEPQEKPEEASKKEPEKKADADQMPAPVGPAPKTAPKQKWYTIGSADPKAPYRMLVTVTDCGAAVARIELNSPRYRALMDDDGYLFKTPGYLAYTGGYLGRVTMERDKQGKGCLVQTVGRGTPAERAGLKPGDLITKLDGQPVTGAKKLHELLAKKKPGRSVKLTVVRDRKKLRKPLVATLTRPPLEVVRPEADDPLSFLMTLSQIGDEKLPDPLIDKEQPKDEISPDVNKELKGVNLRRGTWKVARHTSDLIEFRCRLPRWNLELVKVYRLTPIPKANQEDSDYPAYDLTLDVKVRNLGQTDRKVAYQLDGPTGLPIEGWWYAMKVGRCWSAGLRDVIVSFNKRTPSMVGCVSIADDKIQDSVWQGTPDDPLSYIGVDAQYFSAILIPNKSKENPNEAWFSSSQPLRVGKVHEKIKNITDVSCRLRSVTKDLKSDGGSIEHSFTVFTGPKRPDILTHYGLDELVYYGWFDVVARPMVWILHFFQGLFGNYGLAILLLTVLVRGLMYPMSRKQALGMQKMAKLQPEIKKLQEKYKKDLEARTKAQQELFKKHNYNPASGCLVMFVQLPVFIGLYRGLMVDVELRGSPLLWSGIRWCSNLSAPDMLFDWHNLLGEYFTYGTGMFALGPYFNILPLFSVVLILLQQKMFMPPPADEQQRMQQNIMKYMMLFMGILFFKFASGLCVYFVASSVWGLAERKLLPKTPSKEGEVSPSGKTPPKTSPKAGSNGSPKQSKGKKPGRRK
ncbi:MAG: YidC/Oxa1 family insertase periplasmic-domain containing protein, partial [Pirellulales bacterium]|nr:YidC/Oxa1 family insertase periplasmic-domain containing protein [Pirellulales bacterium]